MSFFSKCYKGVLGFAMTIFWIGCGTSERVENSQALISEMEAKQIKRFTSAEISNALQMAGEKIAVIANQEIEKDTSNLEDCTSGTFLKSLTPIEKRLGVQVSLLLAKDTTNTALFDKEKALLEAYHYQSHQPNAALSEHLQKINDTLSVYYAPVSPDSPLFKTCREAEISSFAVWRIVLNQKDVIKHMK